VSGHGWVIPNPGGVVARCGGPGMCSTCAREKAEAEGRTAAESPAKTIRRAAALMRERAAAAPRSPWWTGEGVGGTGYPKLILNEEGPFAAAEWTMAQSWPPAGDYIASWHPLVALTVAAWLESEAGRAERPGALKLTSLIPGPLAVARAYLGEAAS
jgi:hypothetical protein